MRGDKLQDDRIVELYWNREETAIDATEKKYGAYLMKIAYNILADREDSRECVNIRTEDGRMCASISGDIDHHSAREMRLRIDTAFAVSDARELILDMSGVKFMDSSGLGLILGRFTKASAQGASFGVINPSESVKRVLDIAGAQRLISIKTEDKVKNEKQRNEASHK